MGGAGSRYPARTRKRPPAGTPPDGSPLVLLARRHLESTVAMTTAPTESQGGARYLGGAAAEETGPRAGRTESHAASFEFRRTAASSSAVGRTFQAVQSLRSLAFG